MKPNLSNVASYVEALMAWSNGRVISVDYGNGFVEHTEDMPPMWSQTANYQVNAGKKSCIRVYQENHRGEHCLQTVSTIDEALRAEAKPGFVRWKTDWIKTATSKFTTDPQRSHFHNYLHCISRLPLSSQYFVKIMLDGVTYTATEPPDYKPKAEYSVVLRANISLYELDDINQLMIDGQAPARAVKIVAVDSVAVDL